MEQRNKTKKIFPGGNTTLGFYSFYDYIVKPNANRVFILKGGPGVGKSHFMKKVAQEIRNRDCSMEEFYCSSSNDALDAIVVPDLKVAIIDGTAPHIVDPKNPGAVDEIINLGEYWDVLNLENNKEEIMAVNKEVGYCFQRAFSCLKVVNLFVKDIEEIIREGIDKKEYYKVQEDLLKNIFTSKESLNKVGFERHLFGSGITPLGHIDYLETIVGDFKNIYYLKGDWGTGWSDILEAVSKKAVSLGYDVEAYHTPMEPTKIADLIIPELDIAITTSEKFKEENASMIDFNNLISKEILEKHKEEITYSKKMQKEILGQSVHYINKAKLTHDKLESFYIPTMDFDKVNIKRKETVERILKYRK